MRFRLIPFNIDCLQLLAVIKMCQKIAIVLFILSFLLGHEFPVIPVLILVMRGVIILLNIFLNVLGIRMTIVLFIGRSHGLGRL